MSTYNITLANDGSGNITPTVRRIGTPASGGTLLTIPAGELFPGTTTLLLGLAGGAALRAALNSYATNPTGAYHITLTDNGTGVFTPLVRLGGTAASGGTVLTQPAGELFPGSTTLLMGLAGGSALRAALNDRSAGN